jgi:hypothetical protein
MAIGKKEQIAVISIAAIAAIALVHFFIFEKRAEDYKTTQQEYNAGVQKLSSAEFIKKPAEFEEFKQQTQQYQDMVSSVSEQLNVQPPAPLANVTTGAIEVWGRETLPLLKQLVDMRAMARPQLTFLDNKTQPSYAGYPAYQLGWNLPRQFPGEAAVADNVAKLTQYYGFMQSAPNPQQKVMQRYQYNNFLAKLGIPPAEVSNFLIMYPGGQQLFFNDSSWISLLYGTQAQNQHPYNIYGLNRFGVAVPAIKKMYMYELIRQRLTGANPAELQNLATALEIGVPLEGPAIDTINKQLRSLIEIIQLAKKNDIQEISQVSLLRPIDMGKSVMRQPGVTPSPTAAPTPTPANAGMMGMPGMMDVGMGAYGMMTPAATPLPADQKIGIGTGIEMYFRGNNANNIRFLYDLSHIARTYSLDDLYMYGSPDGVLNTSVTVELVTQIDKLSTGSAEAAPTPPTGVVPAQ